MNMTKTNSRFSQFCERVSKFFDRAFKPHRSESDAQNELLRSFFDTPELRDNAEGADPLDLLPPLCNFWNRAHWDLVLPSTD